MVILVTGCGSGLGRYIVNRGAARGHRIYAGLRSLGEAQSDAQPLDPRVIPLQLDVTSAADRGAALARILEAEGRLDGLVNNAGVVLGGFSEMLTEDEVRHVMEVNFFSVFNLTQACLPALRESRGAIVNISSISGLRAFAGLGGYAASKFALEGLTEAMAQELKEFGVRVSLVEPGTFRTPIWQRNKVLGRNTYDPASPYAKLTPRLDAAFDASADGSAGDPEIVAARVIELLESPSPKLRHVLWGSRRARLLFCRMQEKMNIDYPEDP